MRQVIKDGELITALATAQCEFPVLSQNKSGYNYTYLTLDHILNQLRPILGKQGIVFTQSSSVEMKDEMPFIKVESRVMHKAEYIESDLVYPLGDAPKGMSQIQYMGSIISYLRRYGAISILGIAGSEKEIEDIQTESIKLK